MSFRSYLSSHGDGEQLSVEAQLSGLQEQLVAVMLENQHLADELKSMQVASVQDTDQLLQQLEREREKSRILMERLQERDTREKGEREARERERHPREKSLPPGDKSPSLPQRIRKHINKMQTKSGSLEGEDGSPGPPPPPPPSSFPPSPNAPVPAPLGQGRGEERLGVCRGVEPGAPAKVKSAVDLGTAKSSPPLDAESASRGRFAWKRRGLEKSKSLDQSEFLASTGGGGGAADSEYEDEPRRESDSDEGERALLLRGVGGDSGAATPQAPSSPEEGLGEGVAQPWWRRAELSLTAGIVEVIRDFSEVAVEEQPQGDPEGDPLTVKKLKENIIRFGSVMRPVTESLAVLHSLLLWESTSATLLALVVYLYSVLFGWLLTLVTGLAILKLSVNYLKKSGWTVDVMRRLRGDGGEGSDVPEVGLGDKFALVLQVARRVQNQLGAVSNAAEKCKNLLLWEHEATRRLYGLLWALLLASLVLSSAQLFTLAGLYVGLKTFVLDYIFYRYPRIRLKYDSTSRLWDTLPTDADLERRADKGRGDNGWSSPDVNSFLELFNLNATETPLPGWQNGKRCTLVNRDRSLTSAFKNGRLYLTNSYLCFERSKSQSSKNLRLALKEVRVDKANSYPWIPGGGMAIEITPVETGKAHFFAGIMNRDEVYESILEACRRAGASWPDATPEARNNKDTKDVKEVKEEKKDK